MRVDQYDAKERKASWLEHYAAHKFAWNVHKYICADNGACIIKASYNGDTICGVVRVEMSGNRIIIDGDMGFALAYLTEDAITAKLDEYDAYYLANKITMTDRSAGRDKVCADSVGAWLAALSVLPHESEVA